MDTIEQLIAWAGPKGVKLNGLGPQRMPGRGIGLVATREIQPNEIVLEIPIACLRTLDTVPKPLVRKLPPKMSVHGLLAADLMLDGVNPSSEEHSRYAAWDAVCPTPEDLSTAPLLWPEELQALLPRAARELLDKQKAKFAKDWAGVRPVAVATAGGAEKDVASGSTSVNASQQGTDDKDGDHEDEGLKARYKHAWLLVNTRTFYYTNAKLKKRPRDDHMALQPVADLFNHTDDDSVTCKVSFDYRGFSFRASKIYNPGDEVHICYGRHGNDKLLVEYGFAMDENRWDEVVLDEVVLAKLDESQRDVLEEFGFLGKYVLDREGVCYRTQVAVRMLCCKHGEWRRFVDGADDGEATQEAVDLLVLGMLRESLSTAATKIEEVGGMAVGRPEQREMLVRRWKQIYQILQTHIHRIVGKAQS